MDISKSLLKVTQEFEVAKAASIKVFSINDAQRDRMLEKFAQFGKNAFFYRFIKYRVDSALKMELEDLCLIEKRHSPDRIEIERL